MSNENKSELYALVETIDYNNGETTASSEVRCIGTKEECEKKLIEIRDDIGHDVGEIDCGWYWEFTYDGGETHVFTIKKPS